MKVDKLIGSFLTYEMFLPKSEKKNKSMAFKHYITDLRKHVGSETNDDINDAISMLANNYGKVM